MNFSETTKLHEPVGLVQFVVFEKFISAYFHQIAIEIMLLLINNLHEKRITDSQDRRHFGSTRAICNLHSRYNFTLVFIQSYARTFSMYIINCIITVWLANTYMHGKSAIRTELNEPSHNEKKK